MRIFYDNAKRAQIFLSQKVKIERLRIPEESLVGGVDVAYRKNLGVAVLVLMKYGSRDPEEVSYVALKDLPPYVPGLLYLREAPPAIRVILKLRQKLGVLLVNGHGLAHPRKMGLASHIGLVFNIPTIGVAKKLLYGKLDDSKDPPLICVENEAVGAVLKTNEGKLYVSIGHKVSLDDAIRVVRDHLFDLPLPSPLWHADRISKEKIKELIKSNS